VDDRLSLFDRLLSCLSRVPTLRRWTARARRSAKDVGSTFELGATALATIFEFSPGSDTHVGVNYRNFHDVEEDFAWARSCWGEIEFSMIGFRSGSYSRVSLEVDVDVFRPPIATHNGTDCYVYLGGVLINCSALKDRSAIVVAIAPAMLSETTNRLTFVVDKASRPDDYGVPDTRTLGIKLFSVRIVAS